MRIAYLVSDFPSSSSPARVDQIEGVLERGYDVQVYATERPPDRDLADVSDELAERITYTPIPGRLSTRSLWSLSHFLRIGRVRPSALRTVLDPLRFGRDALSLRPLYRMAALADESFDLLHAHRGNAARMGAILKEVGVCDVLVSTFHGYGVRHTSDDLGRYQHLFEAGDCFMGNSRQICEELRALGVDDDLIRLQYNGLELSEFPFRWESAETTDLPDTVRVVSAGSVLPVKGYEHGVDAIAKLSRETEFEVEYHVFGGESDRESKPELGSRTAALRERAEELGVGDRVEFHGHVARDRLLEEFARADVYMLSSLHEGLPTVVLEAQAVGLPLVVTDAGGTTDAVSDAARVVSPGDADALCEGLRDLLQRPSEWPELGRRGREFVRETFGIQALNDQLVETYETLVAEDGPP